MQVPQCDAQRQLDIGRTVRVLGQFDQPYASRVSVWGVLKAPVMLFWDIEEK